MVDRQRSRRNNNHNSNSNNIVYYASRAKVICGTVSTAFVVFAIGLACLIFGFAGFFGGKTDNDCRTSGKPPLIVWVFGTGIAFSIISLSFVRVTTGRGGTIDWWILGFANCFIAVWAFLGIRSMLLYKQDCIEANSTVWNMALAAVTASFLVCCCGGFIGYRVRQAEAEIVHEEDGDEVEVPTNEAEIVSVREVASNDSSVVDVATEGKQRDETTTAEAKGFPEEESRIETEHNHSRTAETKTDIES